MPISSRPPRLRRSGMTLIELMIACGLTGLIVTAVCGVYVYALRLWDRGQASGSAYMTASLGMDRICQVIEQGNDAQMTMFGDLKIWMARDKNAGSDYVPYWENNSEFHYRTGDEVIFYLSDSTGWTSRTGNILWRRVNGTPDAAWSLLPSSTIGRVSPVQSLSFQVSTVDSRKIVRVILTVQEKRGRQVENLTLKRYVYLRNHN